jgi:hypothetical protein
MKEKRGKGRFPYLQRMRFALLGLIAFLLVSINFALVIDMTTRIISGERYYAGNPSPIIILLLCVGMIFLIGFATFRTYRHIWHNQQENLI